MKKYNLTTGVSSFNKFNSIIIFFIILFVLCWNIYISYYLGIILSILGLFFVYINFFKNSNKNKIIEFTDKYVYIGDKVISIKYIVSLEKGKIIYLEGKSCESIKFEFNYLEPNFYILKKFWKKELSSDGGNNIYPAPRSVSKKRSALQTSPTSEPFNVPR
jgi:hypothetical protein